MPGRQLLEGIPDRRGDDRPGYAGQLGTRGEALVDGGVTNDGVDTAAGWHLVMVPSSVRRSRGMTSVATVLSTDSTPS